MRTTLALIIVLGILALGSMAYAAGVPESNVAGKKLIRVDQTLSYYTDANDLAGKLDNWQQSGYDGLCLSLFKGQAKNPDGTYNQSNNLTFAWWKVEEIKPEEIKQAVDTLAGINNWGVFKHNFLWTASHVDGNKPPNWFNDAHWKIVLANTKLSARLAKKLGFEGILFDTEGYGGAQGVWRQPWDYLLYSNSDYVEEKRTTPRPFEEVATKVRQRGKQWAETLCNEYPNITIFVIPGLYEVAWERSVYFGKGLDGTDGGLWAPFIDGILMGLGKEAKLVGGSESTYLDSQFSDMLVQRNKCLEQSLVVSTVPDLARKRITFSAGIWTDAGYGAHGRFSPDDVTVNQRDPDRHMHAVHNSLAASDEYAWQWGEWGKAGEYNFLTDKPTPLMREYWKANIDGHKPQELMWEPTPVADITDYTQADALAAAREPAFWSNLAVQGYTTVVNLPEFWKFRFDPEMKVRYSNWTNTKCDDSSWFQIKCTQCWQSQGTRANGPGVYRVKFEVPATVDPKTQDVVLAFSGTGSGTNYIYMNNAWVATTSSTVNVNDYVKPGETNMVALVCLNKQGPGGLMGSVNLMTKAKK